jgi:hypothetical protein
MSRRPSPPHSLLLLLPLPLLPPLLLLLCPQSFPQRLSMKDPTPPPPTCHGKEEEVVVAGAVGFHGDTQGTPMRVQAENAPVVLTLALAPPSLVDRRRGASW